MPLVRGTAPKTPRLHFASQFETHFLWEVTATRTRNRHVSVWLTDAELTHLRKQATAAGLGIDPFLRSLILGVQLRPRPPDTYAALSPVALASFAGEGTSQMGRAFLKSYTGVCLEGAVIVLACIVFSTFAASDTVVLGGGSVVTQVWGYLGEVIFNMLVLVGLVKGADCVVREMFGM